MPVLLTGNRGLRIRSQKDFWCGVIFLVIGVAVMVLAREYRFGTAARMGPGFFPTLLGGLLAALGLGIALPALLRDGEAFPRLHMRPMLMLLVSIVIFGLLLEPLGFILASIALLLVGGIADPDLKPLESLGLALLITAFSVVVFVLVLGLPLSLWPSL
jgi:hypothetical protein